MIPVSLEIIQRTISTAKRITMIRSTVRVGTPDASTAAFAAVAAVSVGFFAYVTSHLDSRVQPSDKIAHCFLILDAQPAKFNSECIRSRMMDHLSR